MQNSTRIAAVGVAVCALALTCCYVYDTVGSYRAESDLVGQIMGGHPSFYIAASNGEGVVGFTDPGVGIHYPEPFGIRWCILRVFETDAPARYPHITIDTETTFNRVARDANGVTRIERTPIDEVESFAVLRTLKSVTLRGDITCELIEHLATAPTLKEIVLEGSLIDASEAICDSILECPHVETVDLRDVESGGHSLASALEERGVRVLIDSLNAVGE